MSTDEEFKSEEFDLVAELIAGDVFSVFKRNYPVDSALYRLDLQVLSNAVQNAAIDIKRVGLFHSTTGANLYRKAAYVSRWIADAHPIQIIDSSPLNLNSLNLLRLNSTFAVFCIDAMLASKHKMLYSKLARDIRYCFEFRYGMDAAALALLLEHGLNNNS